MSAKLTDDHIKWILDLDAEGIQGELVKVSSQIKSLTIDNKNLASEMKEASKQMNDAQAAMTKLEKVFQTNSVAYKEAKATFESAKNEVADYQKKIESNTVAIAKHKQTIDTVVKSMNIQDMTMTQLKQRAADLEKQMAKTSISASPDAYKNLDKQLSAVNSRMGEVKDFNKGLLAQFAEMHNPVGSAAQTVIGFSDALSAIFKSPYGLLLAGIAAAFYLIKTAVEGSEEATVRYNAALKSMHSLSDSFTRGVTLAMAGLYDLAKGDTEGYKENIAAAKQLSDQWGENARYAGESAEMEEKLNKAIARREDLTKVANARIAELREVSQDVTKTLTDRESAFKEMFDLGDRVYGTRVKTITESFATFSKEHKNFVDQLRRDNPQIMNVIDQTMDKVRSGQELTFKERIALTNSVNDVTSKLDKWGNMGEEGKKQFRSYFSDLSEAEQQHFDGRKRDERIYHAMEQAAQDAALAAAKKAIQDKLKAEDEALKTELNKLKKQQADGLITEEQYNTKAEQATIDSVNRKLKIRGLEKNQILDLQNQLSADEIKLHQDQDKEMLKGYLDARDKQLAIIESARETQLKSLEDQNLDPSTYAVRAAQVESDASTARLAVVTAYGDNVAAQEFKNADIRVDAIKKSGDAVVDATKANQKDIAAAQDKFDKEQASLDKKYKTQTLDEQKADELKILTEMNNTMNPNENGEKLLSDEAYQVAVTALDKKYEDQRLKVRQQYGLASMGNLYNSELDALNEQLRTKAISEEDYEKAKLKLKLDYAQKAVQEAEKFTSAGTNAVQALQQAETASIEAESTKQVSVLTDKYNKGLISQDDYNKQKEQLDYEAKVKELDVQKKYADAAFAMQVAQITAASALGIMEAWASSVKLGPIAGPIAAGILTGLLTVTAAAQIAAANAQREQVKSMTLEAPSSSSGTAGTIVNSTTNKGYFDGGYTGDGGKYEVAGYLPDGQPWHKGEYFVAQEEMRRPDVVAHVRAIESVRRQRTSSNPLPGFADAGFHSNSSIPVNNDSVSRFENAITRLEKLELKSSVNYYEFEDVKNRVTSSREFAKRK